MSTPAFTLETFQNEYLPAGGREVHAILTVTAETGTAETGLRVAPADAAEIIIVDCSGSMGGSKIVQAKQAVAAAIDAIRDKVTFAVIEGTDTATPVYPGRGGLAVASHHTREEAKQAVRRLRDHGGTAIGTWLRLARDIFGTGDAALRHAILLTDGHNGEGPGQLEAAIAMCEGVFSCDCRGVGTDWSPAELRKIATALLGTLDIVPEPDGLAADFAAMMTAAMGKEVADVLLRVRTPANARVKYVKQTAPTAEDTTARRTADGDYPTGAWGAEVRDYHLCVEVEPAPVGTNRLAARVSLLHGPEVLGQATIKAIWTDDEELSTRISPQVAHALGQTELAAAITAGLAARKVGDQETATARLGRAVALAHESGNEDMVRLLGNVVDVVDPATGTVRLRKRVSDVDEMMLDVRSSKTVRFAADPPRRRS